jgi:hypothetical protein
LRLFEEGFAAIFAAEKVCLAVILRARRSFLYTHTDASEVVVVTTHMACGRASVRVLRFAFRDAGTADEPERTNYA